MRVSIEVSPGELVDRITILEIRAARCGDPEKRAMAERELVRLRQARRAIEDERVAALQAELLEVNRRLWEIEDDIRDCERRGDFDTDFVALARSVYQTNDARSRIKGAINCRLSASFVDEKSYAPY